MLSLKAPKITILNKDAHHDRIERQIEHIRLTTLLSWLLCLLEMILLKV